MKRRRALFWAGRAIGPVLFAGMAIGNTARGDWALAISQVAMAACLCVYLGLAHSSYLLGYRRGVLSCLEASAKAESPGELLRLVTGRPRRQWE